MRIKLTDRFPVIIVSAYIMLVNPFQSRDDFDNNYLKYVLHLGVTNGR